MSRKQKVDCGNRTAPFWSADRPRQECEDAETHFLDSVSRSDAVTLLACV